MIIRNTNCLADRLAELVEKKNCEMEFYHEDGEWCGRIIYPSNLYTETYKDKNMLYVLASLYSDLYADKIHC